MLTMIQNLMNRFSRDEDGLALTEYLILLGLLIGGVIAAVTLFGGNLSDTWGAWANYFGSGNLDPS